MRWGSARVKEWCCCAARRLTLEVNRSSPICLSYLCICPVAAPPALLICAPHTWALWRDAVTLQQNAGRSTGRITSPIRHRPHIYLVSWKSVFVRFPQISWLFVCAVEVSGVSHFYFGTLGACQLDFQSGTGRNFGMQTEEDVCGWGPARLSNNGSPWTCFVCFSRALCTADIINGTSNPPLLTPTQGSQWGFLLHRPCWL